MSRVHGYLGLLIIPRTVTQNKKKKTLRCLLSSYSHSLFQELHSWIFFIASKQGWDLYRAQSLKSQCTERKVSWLQNKSSSFCSWICYIKLIFFKLLNFLVLFCNFKLSWSIFLFVICIFRNKLFWLDFSFKDKEMKSAMFHKTLHGYALRKSLDTETVKTFAKL